MTKNTEFLMALRGISHAHSGMLKTVGEKYGLSKTEMEVISFIYYNPQRNTARDIVELKMMQKGNVSQAVEALIQKKLMYRRTDAQDRRIVRLHLTEKCSDIAADMDRARDAFQAKIFDGFSDDEYRTYANMSSRIFANVVNFERGLK